MHERRWRRKKRRENLELGGLHRDRDANKEDAKHGDGGVPPPVLRPAVGPARHAPHLRPEVTCDAMPVAVLPSSAAHFTWSENPRKKQI